ncbi:unnamed protein product [Sympodiomycopsis kandeliae]
MALLESQLFTGTGWIPPTEVLGSVNSRVGGGRESQGGGVPVRNNYRGQDISALTSQVWDRVVHQQQHSSGPSTVFDNNREFGDPTLYNFNSSTSSSSYVCRTLSDCEPCPPTKRNHPFCRPYGNRRLVACRNTLDNGLPPSELEFQGWEACGKVVAVEMRDYLEFVMVLILLALAALMLLIKRNRHLLAKQKDPLAIAANSSGSAATTNGTRRTMRRAARVG